MAKKLIQIISSVLEEFKDEESYTEAINEKFERNDYLMWKEKICGKSFGSYNFLNDSTPNNASFTVFSPELPLINCEHKKS